MCKLLYLVLLVSCFAAVALSHPSYLPPATVVPSYEHFEYEPTVVGHTVHSVPTAVSHQSQTIVHEKRPYLRPVVKSIWQAYTPTHTYTPHHHISALSLPVTYSAPLDYTTGLHDYGWSPSYNSVYSGWNGWSGWPLK